MLLRRLQNAFRSQDWITVIVEIIVVVVGIFLGLQVDNWNSERQERALAATYIERISNELELESKLLQHATDYFSTARRHAVSALDGFSKTPNDLDQQFLIDLYQASQVWYVAFNNSAYEELQSTGRIVIIQDADVRTALANHYLRLAALDYTLKANSEYRRVARLQIHNKAQKEIRSKCGDSWVTQDNNFYYVSLPSQCAITLPTELVTSEIERLFKDDELRQELQFHLSVLDAQLGVLANTANITSQTLAKVQQVVR
jgi:hypothetical protein